MTPPYLGSTLEIWLTTKGTPVEWIWIIVAAGIAGFVARWWRAQNSTRRARSEELDGVRRLAEEDVTYLGDQIRRLAPEVEGQVLDEDTRDCHRTAVDSYESAQRDVSQIHNVDDISKVTDNVSTGRYALACLQARLAGGPVAQLRVMCFFNPMHGPSTTEVLWTRPGHGPRRVPACAHDAERVAAKLAPEIRLVQIGARTTPYWAAGDAFRFIHGGLLRERGEPRVGLPPRGLGCSSRNKRTWVLRQRRRG